MKNKLMNNCLLSGAVLFLFSCATPGKKTGIGAGTGAAIGAIAGAVIGHQSGKRDKGALIGGAVGAAIGGGVGNYLDKQAQELARIAEVKRTEQGIVARLKGDILFDTNKDSLQSTGLNNVSEIGRIIARYPQDQLKVYGYTDSTGADSYNLDLSQRRAQSVVNQLVNAGVPMSSIVVKQGKGESNPIADNSTSYGRQQNRRVEIEITVPEFNNQG